VTTIFTGGPLAADLSCVMAGSESAAIVTSRTKINQGNFMSPPHFSVLDMRAKISPISMSIAAFRCIELESLAFWSIRGETVDAKEARYLK
jgi:hypothetical protein